MNEMQSALVKQQNEIDTLLSQVEDLRIKRRASFSDGDRIDYKFIETIEFQQEENTSQNIVFTVPEKTTIFIAERLSLYASARLVSTNPAVDGVNEISFRPCVFSWYEGAFNPSIQADSAPGAVDLFLEIAETYYKDGRSIQRSYQNMPIPSETLFSGAINFRGAGSIPPVYDSFQFPTGFIFPCPYLFTGGSSMTLKIAPSFAGVRTDPVTTPQNEYQIKAVLEGKKVVRS